jgi:Glyoxalase-like domain
MTLRLRQICLVAPHLEPSVSTICTVLGTMVSYVDPNVEKYGLINALMPFGNSFLEVVAPTRDGTAAGRYLERRGGEGGYMVILDCDDIEPWLAHLPAVGVRVANDLDYPGEYRGLQLHPRDTGGALLELNHSHGGAWDGPYHPAGPRWKGAHGLDAEDRIVAAELQSDDPVRLSGRWSEILQRKVRDAGGVPTIELDLGVLRFVPATDGRGEGLGGIDVKIPRHERARFAARQKEVAEENGALMLCGTRVRLV